MSRVMCVLALAISLAAADRPLHAQAAAFDVASVKPNNPNPSGPLAAAPLVLPALGRLTAQNVTLRMLVMAAYFPR